MRIINYNYDQTEVTAVLVTGNYLWIAFEGSGGNCTLYKTSAFNPEQIFFEITVPVDKITKMKADSNYIYLAVEDDTYSGAKYSLSDPLVTYDFLTRPAGITEEKTVDIVVKSSTEIFILVPGEISADNAKLIEVDDDFDFVQTIDLTGITYARTMDIDGNDNIWIGTYTNPGKVVKVYEASGGGYSFTTWTIS